MDDSGVALDDSNNSNSDLEDENVESILELLENTEIKSSPGSHHGPGFSSKPSLKPGTRLF